MEWVSRSNEAPPPQQPAPRKPAKAPAGGLDLADEPEPEEEEEYEEAPDEDYDDFDEPPKKQGLDPQQLDMLKKGVMAAVALIVIAVVAVNFMSGDKKKRKRGVPVAPGPDTAQVDPTQPTASAKPKPTPEAAEDPLAEAEAEAQSKAELGDFVGAIQTYASLPKATRRKHKSQLQAAYAKLGAGATEQALAEAKVKAEEGDYDGAIAFLEPLINLRAMRGRPKAALTKYRNELVALRRKAPKGPRPAATETPKPEPTAEPTAKPKPSETPRPTASKKPKPDLEPTPWIPKPIGSHEELLADLPNGKIVESKNYIIVTTANEEFTKTARGLLETVRKGFYKFFRKKEFEVREHPEKLVAYVFGSREDYEGYVRKSGIGITSRAAGFYFTGTNALYFSDQTNSPRVRKHKEWIAAYDKKIEDYKKQRDKANREGNKSWAKQLSGFILREKRRIRKYRRENRDFYDSANDGLTIHEATHQLCYNTGILTPSDVNPEWVVEGLAMLFEDPGVWKGRYVKGANESQIDSLANAREAGRRMTVRNLVGTNRKLISQNDPGFAYASAWALIHMFVRGKFKKYKVPFLNYLKGVQQRSLEAGWRVRGTAAAEVRVKQFEEAFGEIDSLEAEYKAYVDKLADTAEKDD